MAKFSKKKTKQIIHYNALMFKSIKESRKNKKSARAKQLSTINKVYSKSKRLRETFVNRKDFRNAVVKAGLKMINKRK